MNTHTYSHYMNIALALAERGRCTVSPNPMVGCVIVNHDKIIGQGFHQYAGQAHAEIMALSQAGEQAKGATLYVTLEPCCHHGKTPPCSDALIASGIKKVIIACIDPNPLNQGKGIQALKSAGLQVEVGLCEQEAKQLNQIFFHYMQTKQPFIIAKWAMSLDGKTCTHKEDVKQISSRESQFKTHQIRQQVDAILIGAATARDDNPLLNVRLLPETKIKNPIRIVLLGKEKLPLHLNIFTESANQKTFIITTQPENKVWLQPVLSEQVELIIVKADQHHRIDLIDLLRVLAERNITSLLIEGGMAVHQQFLQANLVNKLHVILSPYIIANFKQKQAWQIQQNSLLGNDYYLTVNKDVAHV
jgi:diaminohydroxyphosphoribosylaminopyrimidine deaminase / 5-amino-6-(5-phosphoribosylamino)uracil reductase